MLSERFDVGDEVIGGVSREVRAVGDVGVDRPAALVEQHDPVGRGIEEAAVRGIGAAARTAVQEDDRLAVGFPLTSQ